MIYFLGMKSSNKKVALLNTEFGEMKDVSANTFFSKITDGGLTYKDLMSASMTQNTIDVAKLDKLIKKDIYVDNRKEMIEYLVNDKPIVYYLGTATGTLMYVLNKNGVAETVYRINNGLQVLNAKEYNMTWPVKDDNYSGVFMHTPAFTYTCDKELSYTDAKSDIKKYVMPEVAEFQANCLLLGLNSSILGKYEESTYMPGAITWKCNTKDLCDWLDKNDNYKKIDDYKVYEVEILEGVTVLEPNCIDLTRIHGDLPKTIIHLKFPESLTFISPDAIKLDKTPHPYALKIIYDLSRSVVTDIRFSQDELDKPVYPNRKPQVFILPRGIKSISCLSDAGLAILTSKTLKKISCVSFPLILKSVIDNDNDKNLELSYIGKHSLIKPHGVIGLSTFKYLTTMFGELMSLYSVGEIGGRFPHLEQIDGDAPVTSGNIVGSIGAFNSKEPIKLYGAPLNKMTKPTLTRLTKVLDSYTKYTYMTSFKITLSKGCSLDKDFNYKHQLIEYAKEGEIKVEDNKDKS